MPIPWALVLVMISPAAGGVQQSPSGAAEGKPAAEVAAVVESTLPTADGHIRQFARDGDPQTYFASQRPATARDHFTLVLDRQVMLKSLAVATGKPAGGDELASGVLEVSGDGKTFEPAARFVKGAARVGPRERAVQAVRIRPGEGPGGPLVIREIALDSAPPVAVFAWPVEFTVDVTDAPEMKEWADKVARICERAYPMINEELKSPGFRPATQVSMALKKDYKGVAATAGSHIFGSPQFFKDHPEDVGAMVHETVHVVQRYRVRPLPGWLVEGIADYVRFFKFEPGKLGRIDPKRARYDGSYRVSAAFLAYLAEKYDRELVRKLNQALREGTYSEALFEKLTGKPLAKLGEEWKATLAQGRQ